MSRYVTTEIERAETDDAEEIVSMWVELADSQRAHGSHIPGEPNRTQIREVILRYITGGQLLVARNEAVRGFVMFSIEQGTFEQAVTRGVVENIYVNPSARNSGVGSALLASVEDTLETRGVDTVSLNVMAANEDARRFYRRHGYEPHRVEVEKLLDDTD